ncbi:protein cereblon-like [Zerene cesonia]|uniref:protein cereblon-like n=1 Tax=Zerene cesonia TaxID=33412 RepID=UPI0018E554E2|nr:protein cereblon-like [Zerene cesonia]
MLAMLILLIFLNVILSSSYAVKHDPNILCRTCGNNILKASDIISKESPSSLYSFNDTIFNEESSLVQILRREVIFQFTIVTSNQSNCIGFGEWEKEELWFPGYHWKPCLCPECGDIIGWLFENHNPEQTYTFNRFYALILPNLLSEKVLQSLISYPV